MYRPIFVQMAISLRAAIDPNQQPPNPPIKIDLTAWLD
jgi:hypothetical protein